MKAHDPKQSTKSLASANSCRIHMRSHHREFEEMAETSPFILASLLDIGVSKASTCPLKDSWD